MGFAVPARAVTGKASSSVRGSVRPFFEFIHGIQVPPSLSLRNTDLQVRVDIRHSELCILHHRWIGDLSSEIRYTQPASVIHAPGSSPIARHAALQLV